MKKLNWAIMGTGTIASKFAETAGAMKDELNLCAVAARNPEKARIFAEKYGIGKSFGSFAEMLKDGDIDAVYIGTPNSAHFENARACLESGKHVLCEKPLTLNAREARALFALAESKKLFLMEAYWTKFMPFMAKVHEIIDSGEIGEVYYVTASYGFAPPPERLANKIDPARGGGALLDLCAYGIGFPCMIFGYDVKSAHSAAKLNSAGTDELEAAIMDFGGGKLASVQMSIGVVLPRLACVYGTNGSLQIPDFNGGSRVIVTDNSENSRVIDCPFEITGFEYEIRESIACIAAGKTASDIMKPEHTVAVLEIADAFRRDWGVRFPSEG